VGALIPRLLLCERSLLLGGMGFLPVASDRCCGGFFPASWGKMGADADRLYFNFDRSGNYRDAERRDHASCGL